MGRDSEIANAIIYHGEDNDIPMDVLLELYMDICAALGVLDDSNEEETKTYFKKCYLYHYRKDCIDAD